MEYTCILKSGSRRETWTGRLILLDRGNGWYEAEIHGRGTCFHVLAGRHKYGNYLCIPVNAYDELNSWAIKDMAERIMAAELYDYEIGRAHV